MKTSKKQKNLIIAGIVAILLTPFVVILGSPLLAARNCAQSDYIQSVCTGISSIYAAVILVLPTLLIGAVLILIAFFRKN